MGRQEAGDKTHRGVLPSFAFRQIFLERSNESNYEIVSR